MSEETKEQVVEAASAKECKCCCKGWSAKALRWAVPVSGIVAALAAITVVISGLGYLFCGGASFEKPDFDKAGVKFLKGADAKEAEEAAKKVAKEFEEKWDEKIKDALKECDLKPEDAKNISKEIREDALQFKPQVAEGEDEVDEETLADLHDAMVKGFISWVKDAKKYAKKNEISLDKDSGKRIFDLDKSGSDLWNTYKSSFQKNLSDVKKVEEEGKEKTDERAHRFTVALLVLAFALTVPVLVRIERNTRA